MILPMTCRATSRLARFSIVSFARRLLRLALREHPRARISSRDL
jgi:hypothetical protein